MARIVLPRNLSAALDSVTATQGPAGAAPWLTSEQNQLVPFKYDFLDLTYDVVKPDLITVVVYKTGGAGGTTVATLTLTYDSGDHIKTVTRT